MPSAVCAALCSAQLPHDHTLSSTAARLTPQAQSSLPFTAVPFPLPLSGISTEIVTRSVRIIAINNLLCSDCGA